MLYLRNDRKKTPHQVLLRNAGFSVCGETFHSLTFPITQWDPDLASQVTASSSTSGFQPFAKDDLSCIITKSAYKSIIDIFDFIAFSFAAKTERPPKRPMQEHTLAPTKDGAMPERNRRRILRVRVQLRE